MSGSFATGMPAGEYCNVNAADFVNNACTGEYEVMHNEDCELTTKILLEVWKVARVDLLIQHQMRQQ